MRIKNKTYGICREETGNLIDAKRLRAVPHATLSIEAKLIEAKKDVDNWKPYVKSPAIWP